MNSVTTDMPTMPVGREAIAYFNLITSRHFVTLNTRLVAGRDFDSQDTPSRHTSRSSTRPSSARRRFIVIALVAAYLPARRATRVDPIIALRAE